MANSLPVNPRTNHTTCLRCGGWVLNMVFHLNNGLCKQCAAGWEYCRRCQTERPKAEFGEMRGCCKKCLDDVRTYYPNKPRLTTMYGLTPEQYDMLLIRQGFKCAICRGTAPLQTDHCHTRGGVRGLLCRPCNLGLGNFQDDANRLRAAADYLEWWGRMSPLPEMEEQQPTDTKKAPRNNLQEAVRGASGDSASDLRLFA